MTSDRWLQIQAVFQEALEHEPPQRAAFLDEACRENPDLRAEVVALLEADAQAGTFLEDTPLPRPEAPEATPFEGRQIGPYRLIHELGQGGMGAVYLAERTDGHFQQQVAIKLVRSDRGGRAIRQRFRYERQILARLNHPNIARLYDGGVTDEGLPYLVMEYVDGLPIDTYCDTHRLSTRERLHLFHTVGTAVQYAHQNLVVHRDLKPSNILVTETGTVKLLDFGIAKLLDEEATQSDEVPLTRTGMRVMTPEYASPEQVRGEPITTAADVYALGVILYELLTGHRPYQIRGLSLGETERVICEEEPARPSTAVNRVRDSRGPEGETRQVTPEEISQARNTDPSRLRRQLSGDLDNIVLMALRKEPSRRYASVEQLAEDVRRYLVGRTVSAHADTVRYRAAKFIRRHRLGLASTVAALLLAAAMVSFYTTRLAHERDRAQAEAAKAERINAFLQEMLSSANPSREGREVKVVDVLDDAAARLESELADQPEIEADVRRTIGITYQDLGLYDEAETQLQRALNLRRTHLGPNHAETAQSLKDFALVKHWQGDLNTAATYYQQALALFRTQGTDQVGFAETLNDYGTLLTDQSAYDEAAAHFDEALAMMRVVRGDEHIDIAAALNNLGLARHWLGDIEAADSLYRQALAMRYRLVGPDNIEVAHTLNNLAWVYLDKDDPAGADSLFRASLVIRRKQLGDEHPNVALALLNLATQIYVPQNDYDEADTLLQEALSIFRKAFPDDHPYTSNALYGLGKVRVNQGRLQEAEALLKESLAMRKHLFDTANPLIAVAEIEVGGVLYEQGHYEEAEALLQSSLPKLQATNHVRTQEVLQRLVDLYTDWNKPDRAAEYRALLAASDEP